MSYYNEYTSEDGLDDWGLNTLKSPQSNQSGVDDASSSITSTIPTRSSPSKRPKKPTLRSSKAPKGIQKRQINADTSKNTPKSAAGKRFLLKHNTHVDASPFIYGVPVDTRKLLIQLRDLDGNWVLYPYEHAASHDATKVNWRNEEIATLKNSPSYKSDDYITLAAFTELRSLLPYSSESIRHKAVQLKREDQQDPSVQTALVRIARGHHTSVIKRRDDSDDLEDIEISSIPYITRSAKTPSSVSSHKTFNEFNRNPSYDIVLNSEERLHTSGRRQILHAPKSSRPLYFNPLLQHPEENLSTIEIVARFAPPSRQNTAWIDAPQNAGALSLSIPTNQLNVKIKKLASVSQAISLVSSVSALRSQDRESIVSTSTTMLVATVNDIEGYPIHAGASAGYNDGEEDENHQGLNDNSGQNGGNVHDYHSMEALLYNESDGWQRQMWEDQYWSGRSLHD